MPKELTLTVTLTFSDEVSDVDTIVNNVCDGLVYQANSIGITNDDDPGHTKTVSVVCGVAHAEVIIG